LALFLPVSILCQNYPALRLSKINLSSRLHTRF